MPLEISSVMPAKSPYNIEEVESSNTSSPFSKTKEKYPLPFGTIIAPSLSFISCHSNF